MEKLSTLNPGDTFSLNPANSFTFESNQFITLEQLGRGTLIISKNLYDGERRFGESSDWSKSFLRDFLNDVYYNKITINLGQQAVIPMLRDLTTLDGLDDYGTCIDKVSLLTMPEYAKYHKILGLQSRYPNQQWTITAASTPKNNCFRRMCGINFDGIPNWINCDDLFGAGIRPLLMLDSSVCVSKNN